MSERELIAQKTDGKCYYCGCDLPDRWHKDHLKPLLRKPQSARDENGRWQPPNYSNDVCEHPERDSLENLVPSCPRCNIRKNSMDIETFRDEISLQVDRLMRDSNQFKLAVDYGLIEITGNEVEFYFETIEESQ